MMAESGFVILGASLITGRRMIVISDAPLVWEISHHSMRGWGSGAEFRVTLSSMGITEGASFGAALAQATADWVPSRGLLAARPQAAIMATFADAGDH